MTKAAQSQSHKRRESIVRGGSSKRGESGSRRPDSQIRTDCATNLPKQASQALKNKDTLRGLVSINVPKKSAPKNMAESRGLQPSLSQEFRSLKAQFEEQTRSNQNWQEDFLIKNAAKQDEILEKINKVLDSTIEKKLINGFSKEFYDSALKLAGVDLNVNFTIVDSANNTINLLNTPLSTTNANLFGTKLMSILFTKEEMVEGFVEGDGKSGFRNLDKTRIDLIKACYIKKLRSVNKLVELWPSILVSLRQKSHDSRKASRVRSVLHSTVNEGSADGDGEANDDPIDLVDDLEDSLDVVEEEEEVQEIGEVSGSEQVLEDDEELGKLQTIKMIISFLHLLTL